MKNLIFKVKNKKKNMCKMIVAHAIRFALKAKEIANLK